MITTEYKYFAFISYRGADVRIAKRLQKKFNNFKLPSAYINPFDENNPRMQPVCRDRDNFVGGEVSAQIRDAIDHSVYVVMVCTPNMTQNDDQTNYVNDEVNHLIITGRIDRLIPLVYEGRAYSPDDYNKAGRSIENPFPDECLPYALRKWMSEHNNHNFTLNIFNIEEQGERDEEKMFLRCTATILAEEFTKLWDRYKIEQKRRKRNTVIGVLIAVFLFIVAIISAITLTQPVDIKIKLKEVSAHNEHLPELKDAIVTISIDNYKNTDTVFQINHYAVLDKIPYGYIGKDVRLTINCKDWLPVDTIVRLSKGMTIEMIRDPRPYGFIQFSLWSENKGTTYPNTVIWIGNYKITTDYEGYIQFLMPLAEQDTFYIVKSEIRLACDTIKMPTTENNVVLVND